MSEKTEFSADYFIEKFEKIPEGEWTVEVYYDEPTKRCCAVGHCGCRNWNMDTREGKALEKIFHVHSLDVFQVNDHAYEIDHQGKRFDQGTPRKRILAALKWIKAEASQQ